MPWFLLIVYGFFAASAALLVEILVGASSPASTPSLPPGVLFIILAASIEEGSKWLFLRQFHLRYGTVLTPPALLLAGILFGVGFSMLELLLITAGFKALAWFPLFGILSLHLLTSLAFALYLLGPARHTLLRTIGLSLGMVALHTLYNLSRL